MRFSEGLYVLRASENVLDGSHGSKVISGFVMVSKVLSGSPRFSNIHTGFRSASPSFEGFVRKISTRFAASCLGSPRFVDVPPRSAKVRQGSLAFVRCAKFVGVRSGSHKFRGGLLRIAEVRSSASRSIRISKLVMFSDVL